MSEFVNFGKRGVALPPGCKDLIDVLQRNGGRKHSPETLKAMAAAARPKSVCNNTLTIHVAEVGECVTALFRSHARMRQVEIMSLDDKLNLHIYATDDGQVAALLWLTEDETLEMRLRDFLVSHGLESPATKDECISPISFVPNVPIQVVDPLSPIPADFAAVSNLVKALLHDVAGLSANSEIGSIPSTLNETD